MNGENPLASESLESRSCETGESNDWAGDMAGEKASDLEEVDVLRPGNSFSCETMYSLMLYLRSTYIQRLELCSYIGMWYFPHSSKIKYTKSITKNYKKNMSYLEYLQLFSD